MEMKKSRCTHETLCAQGGNLGALDKTPVHQRNQGKNEEILECMRGNTCAQQKIKVHRRKKFG